ncbi:MAG: hypothetical protein K9H48_14185 [Melioribacteraceae bacterium]|nr:hypothetical protein [Melioribacteraceae bacterium]MCF8395100.1 hypothetical protein [Melioribacteraceae bacterium]MCF8420509.1 hypothetical protein [Melioribacteraceae bacterium]
MISKTVKYSSILFILLCITTIFAGAFLSLFTARSEGEDIILNWQTGEENNVDYFAVERKAINSEFTEIAKLDAKGDNSYYTYIDESAYKTTDVLYIYRIKIVDLNSEVPPTYSKEVSVSHSVSSVKKTWGSIKALFR